MPRCWRYGGNAWGDLPRKWKGELTGSRLNGLGSSDASGGERGNGHGVLLGGRPRSGGAVRLEW